MTPETNPVLTLSQTSMNIRMYDLNGEGDCFLLRFLDDDDVPRHILIDCGIFISTSNGKKRLTDVADDIATITNNHLDILVVTHEHWDHLIGFEYADEVFDNMMIDEVWLAWTENTAGDELAANLHKKYKDTFQALIAVTEKFAAANAPGVTPIQEVLSFSPKTNELMTKVHDKLGQNPPRYCYPTDPPITLPGASQFRFYVLGPPRNEKQLLKLAAETAVHGQPLMIDDVTAFTAAVLASFGESKVPSEDHATIRYLSEHSLPFEATYGVDKTMAMTLTVEGERFFETYYGPDDPDKAWRHIEDDWLGAAGDLALQMNSWTNNTSLVLAIEMCDTGKVLLFPGDAESGNWESWKERKWTINGANHASSTRTGMKLIEHTAFYKCAHHGSQNGTRIEYLQQMRDDLVVMIPVNETWAKTKKKWEHPGKALYKELKTKTGGRIIRADTRIPDEKPAQLSLGEWRTFTSNVYGASKATNDLWIEYKVS
jgi:hypothetical protein